MAKGGAEQVVPILVGIIAMLLVVSYIIASLGPVTASAGGNYQTGGFQITYSPWTSTVHGVDHTTAQWDGGIINEGGASWPGKYVGFNKTGASIMKVTNTHNSTKTYSVDPYDYSHAPSKNYIDFSKWWDSGMWLGSYQAHYSVGLGTISNQLNLSSTHNVSGDFAFGWDWTIPWIGVGWTPENYTYHITTAAATGGWTYFEYLYHGKFNVTLETKTIPAPPDTLAGMFGAIAWVISFGNVGWVPIDSSDTFALTCLLIFGIIVDVTILFCVIRMIR